MQRQQEEQETKFKSIFDRTRKSDFKIFVNSAKSNWVFRGIPRGEAEWSPGDREHSSGKYQKFTTTTKKTVPEV